MKYGKVELRKHLIVLQPICTGTVGHFCSYSVIARSFYQKSLQ